jgi:hypothetical protein
VIVTVVVELTAEVVTPKVALVAPAGMVTFAGTGASDVLLLTRETTTPPLGAALLSVTVPVDELPPLTLLGLTVSDVRVGPELAGITVNTALCCDPL